MDVAIKKAARFGIGFVTANHSNHYGIAGYYSMLASEQHMIGFSCTNTSPLMVPTGAKEVGLGTNPIAFSTPAAKDADTEGPLTLRTKGFQLDMATTGVPLGKIEIFGRKGEKIPSGIIMLV